MTIFREKAGIPMLKNIKALMRDRKARDESGQFIVEGEKAVGDIIRKKMRVEFLLCSHTFIENNNEFLGVSSDAVIPVFYVEDRLFEKISTLRNPQGIMASVRKPSWEQAELSGPGDMIVVVSDNIQDPGNMGAILRASAAFDVRALVLFGEDVVDVFNPKVVRASSGTFADVPTFSMDLDGLKELKKNGYRFLVAGNSFTRSQPITTIKKASGKLAIVFGNEGRGVSEEIMAIADDLFHIPINKRVESLNVLSAASISLFYFSVKQRGRK